MQLRSGALLLRYAAGSLVTAASDYSAFLAAYALLGNATLCVFIARGFSLAVNYLLLQFAVFRPGEQVWRTMPRYIAVVAISGAITAAAIEGLHRYAGVPVVLGKMIAEGLLWGVNYLVLKGRVFNRRPG